MNDLLYKKTTNQMLDLVADLKSTKGCFPSEPELAERLQVSRSTVRKAIRRLVECGIVEMDGNQRIVRRKPAKRDYFVLDGDASSQNELAEKFIFEWLYRHGLQPGQRFSELELSRESGLSRGTIREALLRISRFGLIQKRLRQQWHFIKLDEKIVNELMQMREILEVFSLRELFKLPRSHPAWKALARQLLDHQSMRTEVTEYAPSEFREMDKELHHVWLGAADNRYIDSFFSVCSFFIDFQWKVEPLVAPRVEIARRHHIRILQAALKGKRAEAISALRDHMKSIRHLLIETVQLDSQPLHADSRTAKTRTRPTT